MKIAIIGTTYPFRGGLAAYNERLARQFQNEGHEVSIYTFTVQYPNFLFPGKTQYSTDPAPEGLTIKRCVNSINPFNWLKVGKRIRQSNYDLVITKFWIPFIGPSLGTILRKVRKNKKTKVITIIDNIIPHESRFGDKALTKYFVKPIQAFVAMSQNVYEDLNIFDTQKPKTLSPHPLFDNFGAAIPREDALKTLKLSPDFRYILFFGLIRKYKGLDLLLEAFSDPRFRGSKIKLIIAGEYYSDKEEYMALIKKHQLQEDIVQIDKFIPDSEVATIFSAADLVAQPYKSATQSGVTQIAYHFDKPMIVTNVGGLSEMCPDGKVGYVTNPEPTELAEAMLKFYNSNEKDNFPQFIEAEKKKYSWEVLSQNIFTLASKI